MSEPPEIFKIGIKHLHNNDTSQGNVIEKTVLLGGSAIFFRTFGGFLVLLGGFKFTAYIWRVRASNACRTCGGSCNSPFF